MSAGMTVKCPVCRLRTDTEHLQCGKCGFPVVDTRTGKIGTWALKPEEGNPK